MSIVVHCPGCKTRLTVGDDRAHDEFECPKCDERIRVWTLTGEPEAAPARAEPEPEEDEYPRRSSRRDRDDYEDDEDDRPRRRRRRVRRGYGCPYCGSTELPNVGSRISTAGWITFAILLATCWPLFFIGLLIREEYPICYDCGRALG
jgi:Zn-finger nucleic acid-binding protein